MSGAGSSTRLAPSHVLNRHVMMLAGEGRTAPARLRLDSVRLLVALVSVNGAEIVVSVGIAVLQHDVTHTSRTASVAPIGRM